jgi:hypothetical protein
MDLHKVLNRLAAACAEENVAGAQAHSVLPGDKPMIESFMRGGGGLVFQRRRQADRDRCKA